MNMKNTLLQQEHSLRELAARAKWSGKGMADACRVSVRTLERRVLRETGKPLRAWLGEQRAVRGQELLQQGTMVKVVAADLGYAHATHFSRAFRRYWGHPPCSLTGPE